MSEHAAASATDLSGSLRELLRSRKTRLKLGEVVGRVEGHSGIGPVLFILTLPVLLPLPPGASMVLALPLLMVTPQMVWGRRHLWLPHWLAERTVERKGLVKLIHRIMPWIERLEAMGKPRLRFLTVVFGTRLAGVFASIIALILVLPIPFANLLPALALGLLALGLARRDGLIMLSAYSLFAVAVVVIVWGAHGIRLLFHHLTGTA